MKKYIFFLAFFNLILINPVKAENKQIKKENHISNDFVIIDSTRSDSPDFFDSTDYSIEIRDSNGAKVELGNWRGKNLLVIYAHPDCPYCKRLVKKYEAELQDTTLQTMVLFSRLDSNEINDFREETKLKYPYYIDSAIQFRKRYGTGFVPVTLYINSDGRAERISGLKEKEVENLIQKLNRG